MDMQHRCEMSERREKKWKVIIGTNQIHIINKLVLIEPHNESFSDGFDDD